MVLDDVGGDGPDFGDLPAVPRPSEMVQNRENNYISSVTSTTSPGMAGAGAFRFQQQQQQNNSNKGGFENEQEYYHDNLGQQYHDASGSAVPMQRAPLQAREQYTFGQVPGTTQAATEFPNPFMVDDYDGETHAYSSEPVGHYGNQAYVNNYASYSSPQTGHNAGGHYPMDEADPYGGI